MVRGVHVIGLLLNLCEQKITATYLNQQRIVCMQVCVCVCVCVCVYAHAECGLWWCSVYHKKKIVISWCLRARTYLALRRDWNLKLQNHSELTQFH